MWNNLQLRHFKCFETLGLPLAPMTLLTGFNAAGKSSVIQALAILHQTAVDNEWSTSLLLNGSSVKLGTTSDVLDRLSSRGSFSIELRNDQYRCKWLTSCPDRDGVAAPLYKMALWTPDRQILVWRRNDEQQAEGLQDFAVHRLIPTKFQKNYAALCSSLADGLCKINYISAERLGPRETFERTCSARSRTVGSRGEQTPWYLENFGREQANPRLKITGESTLIEKVVQLWMARFFPGFGMDIKKLEGTNLVKMAIRTNSADDFNRPQNVGYGLTHLLPIVTACVGSRPGDVLLIENPEAHLHPAGQSWVGMFLALTASSGVQVIVETHSDHVLNGLRRAIKVGELKPQDTVIHFFSSRGRQTNKSTEQVRTLQIDQDGSIEDWPKGFFDQIETDLEQIFGN